MNQRLAGMLVLASTLLLGAALATSQESGDRWYSADQVVRGRSLYVTHCAACHGAGGEGQPNWQERDPNTGYYPAPPLDASGHAAEHPLQQMLRTLDQGGAVLGGTMPSFIDVLDAAQKEAVVAYVQSLWPDETYRTWREINAGRAAPPSREGGHQH